MSNKIENVIVFVTGISGIGKRSIGDALCKLDPTFKNVTPDDWLTPILRLFSNDKYTLYSLTPEEWNAINQVRDAVFNTIANICPRASNFVISFELREDNEWHKKFYARIEQLTQEKGALLIPVRLMCDLQVSLTRLVNEERKKFIFKPLDPVEITERFKTTNTFKSGNKHELTLDTTNFSPQESAQKILEHVQNVLQGIK